MNSSISNFINDFNFIMLLLFTLMYSYQIVYIFVTFRAKHNNKNINDKKDEDVHLHKYAVIIAARNEELVIGQLIKSIKNQKYPKELVDIFVVADNCTDDTALAAGVSGAIVRERFNTDQVGKGYALDFMMKVVEKEYSSRKYEGYFVFDADNLLDENYITQMNKIFDQGYRIVTSYRNSKNYNQNWISAGYSLWFLHESEYLNLSRMAVGSSCAISGTGFLLDSDLIKTNKGWIHHLLTEDIEFSVYQIIKGEKIGYCGTAILYDEQPATFSQSWNQRLRWARGFYQVIAKYGIDLIKGIFKRNGNRFACYDMIMTILPAMLVSTISILVNGIVCMSAFLGSADGKEIIYIATETVLKSSIWYYLVIFSLGFITTLTEWKKIHCSGLAKIAYAFTFPLFMLTYLPISIVALLKDVEWKPIAHTIVKSADDFR